MKALSETFELQSILFTQLPLGLCQQNMLYGQKQIQSLFGGLGFKSQAVFAGN